jgi:ankyrin repeat protein
MVLYAPPIQPDAVSTKNKQFFEIVLFRLRRPHQIHDAIKSKNIEMVKVLLNSAKLDHLDYNSSSIFHYAANTSKEMITILTNKSTVNHCNLDGYTPLHAACLSNNPDCVNALLCAGADVNISARHVSNMQSRTQSTSSEYQSLSVGIDLNCVVIE